MAASCVPIADAHRHNHFTKPTRTHTRILYNICQPREAVLVIKRRISKSFCSHQSSEFRRVWLFGVAPPCGENTDYATRPHSARTHSLMRTREVQFSLSLRYFFVTSLSSSPQPAAAAVYAATWQQRSAVISCSSLAVSSEWNVQKRDFYGSLRSSYHSV